MAVSFFDPNSHSIVTVVQVASCTIIATVIYYYLTGGQRPWAGIPIITLADNVPSPWSGLDPDLEAKASEMLAKGMTTTDGCFQIKTGTGFKIFIPNRFAHELRNHKALSITQSNRIEFMTDYRGFDGMRQGSRDDNLMPEVIRVKLTQSLGLIIDDIVDEAAFAIKDNLGDSTDWTECPVKNIILDMVARITTRVFSGKELSRDKTWIHIAKQNTVNTFLGAQDLVNTPGLLRPIRQWLSPNMKELRHEASRARELFAPHTEKRLKAMAENAHGGQAKSAPTIDYWTWVVDQAKGRPIDFTAGQLFLSIVAIHTTTEITTRCIFQLCEMPELISPLREEVRQILQQHGWAKTSLYKMKLLDSFIKEVHRTHPLTSATMSRYVISDFQLSDGTNIPKDSTVAVLDSGLIDPQVYSEPEKFDAFRFMNLRQAPSEESKHQYVALASYNLSFGYGEHACPGRFFASNEIKIVLCLMILGYDLEFEPGKQRARMVESEFTWVADPCAMIRVRRRQLEMNDSLPKSV